MSNKEQEKARHRAYYLKNQEKIKASTRAYRQAHWEQRRTKEQAYQQNHPGQARARKTAFRHRLLAEALRVLGDMCACPGCGVSEPLFLTIDHIHGRPKGPRRSPLNEARASGWDRTKFQILCMNCNFAKRDRGFCPVHQKDSMKSNGHSPGTNAQLGFKSFEGG